MLILACEGEFQKRRFAALLHSSQSAVPPRAVENYLNGKYGTLNGAKMVKIEYGWKRDIKILTGTRSCDRANGCYPIANDEKSRFYQLFRFRAGDRQC
jgi:hypothetical protein